MQEQIKFIFFSNLHKLILWLFILLIQSDKKIFQRGHRKSPSDFDLKYGRDTTPPSSPLKECRMSNTPSNSPTFPLDPECWEVS